MKIIRITTRPLKLVVINMEKELPQKSDNFRPNEYKQLTSNDHIEKVILKLLKEVKLEA